MVLFRPPPHPWRYLVGSTVIAAVIAAVVAAAFVWGPWGRQAYTFAQVEHAVEVIGAPPGFTQEVIRGMSDEYVDVRATYAGTESTADLVTWAVATLDRFGLSPRSWNPGQSGIQWSSGGAQVSSMCQGVDMWFSINQSSDDSQALAISMWVTSSSPAVPRCPSGLFA